MNAAHLHIVLTHVPVVGLIASLAALGWALWRHNEEVRRLAYAGLVLSGLVAVAAFFTGEGAEETVEHLSGFAEAAVERHEAAALVSVWLAAITGALAAGGWWLLSRGSAYSAWATRTVTLAAVVTLGSMAWTANLGGRIGHPEIAGATASLEQPAAGAGAVGSEGAGTYETGEHDEDGDEEDDD